MAEKRCSGTVFVLTVEHSGTFAAIKIRFKGNNLL